MRRGCHFAKPIKRLQPVMSESGRIILMRHGRAESGAPDHARRLTPMGKSEIAEVAKRIKEYHWTINKIRHSGYERARETALILFQTLHPESGIGVMEGIRPEDDVIPVRNELEETNGLLIVSHLPFLDELLYAFIRPHGDSDLPWFTPGTVIALEKDKKWSVAWQIRP